MKKVIPSVVKREDLFVTTKLWNSSHKPEMVEAELDESLKQLGLDYVDLFRASLPRTVASLRNTDTRLRRSRTLAGRVPADPVRGCEPRAGGAEQARLGQARC